MAEPLIRPAMASDLDRLFALRRAFRASQVRAGMARDRGGSAAALRAETAALLIRPRTVLLLADAGGPCGYVLASLQIVPGPVPARVALVEEIFVRPGRARRGLGRVLAERALARLPGGGEGRQQVRVLAGNAAGHAFWRQLGFEDVLVTMERRLEDRA